MKLPTIGGKFSWKDIFTSGCGQESRFVIPYRLPEGKLGAQMAKHHDKELGPTLVACAVDDDMGRWPRFKSVIEEDSF